MRKKYFFLRNMSVLSMCILTAVSSLLALLFFLNDHTGQEIFLPLSSLGDSFIPLIFFSFALWFRNRFCAIIAVVLSFFNIFLRVVSIVLFEETFLSLDLSSLQLLMVNCDLIGIKAVLGRYYLFWLIPLIVAIIVMISYLCVIIWRSSGKRRKKLSVVWYGTFVVLLILAAGANIFYCVISRYVDDHNFYTGHFVKPLPFVVADLADDYYHHIFPVKRGKIELSPESRRVLDKYGMLSADGEETQWPEFQPFEKIIIIAVESLDYNFIGSVNPAMPDGITPELDQLLKEYPSMSNYFTAAQPTNWGLTALIMSRFDYQWELKNGTSASIFTVAASKGFKTYYFSPVFGAFSNNRETYRKIFKAQTQFFLEEWEKYYSKSKDRPNVWGISDPELYDGVIRELKKDCPQRFIAVVSTMDTHPPYNAPELPARKFSKYPGGFLSALHSADRSLGTFLRRVMADKKLYDENTLIVITADHSATHGENYLKRKEYTPDRIPLIFITPRKDVFKKIDLNKFASSIDLAPTLLHLIHCEIPTSFMGRSLFSNKNIALSWALQQVLYIHTPEKSEIIKIKKEPDKVEHRAFYEFFWKHHPDD